LVTAVKGFPLFPHWCGLQQLKTFGFAQVALAMRFKKNSLPDAGVNHKFQLISREKPISHECRAMPVFGVKFNVEFTRQALEFFYNITTLRAIVLSRA